MLDNVDAAWLRPTRPDCVGEFFRQCLGNIVNGGGSTAMETALGELAAAAVSATGAEPVISGEPVGRACIAIGTTERLSAFIIKYINKNERSNISAEGYVIQTVDDGGVHAVIVLGGSERGVLYGVYHLLRLIGSGESAPVFAAENPRNPLRMLNQWDNADGTIERGYAGTSFFYRNGRVVDDLTRVRQYARLLASIGINGIAVNNVNVHDAETGFIRGDGLRGMARLAAVFRAYGIRMYISVNFAAPIWLDNMRTADPLDAGVRAWWRRAAAVIYEAIPDLGGFLVKADSEHRPGPYEYGRNHADGANMLAEALEPFGGIVLWRCFVYNCMQDWRDRSTDRAKAAYEHFMPLDGQFRDNIILQIKNGPMDFQVREPVSPLFGAMTRTNQMLELQVTQEYTGQQRHLCYLVPQWKEVLDFDTHWRGEGSAVKRIAAGEVHPMRYSGMTAVSNVGSDGWWTGHPLAQANLYAFGRLAWNPDVTAEAIAEEWIRLTFGNDRRVVDVVRRMMMSSWSIYESYTAPLGVGWMVAPGHHYGPDVDGYEFSHWGTYHYADRQGVGVDRTVGTGTGYTAQYHPVNGDVYDSLAHCPDELVLFFHHVPYTHELQSGRTVIQHIYDTHFAGAADAEELRRQWRSLRGLVGDAVYERVGERLREQAAHAAHWRDAVNSYFYTKSGIADEQGRAIRRLPFDFRTGGRKLMSTVVFAAKRRWRSGARLMVAKRQFKQFNKYWHKFRSMKGEADMTRQGAFYTGQYRNLFKEYGYSEADITRRLDDTWRQLFEGDEETRIYYPAGDDMGYMLDTGNLDVRTEGMSYGMMMAVQYDRRDVFDRLWLWAHTHMYMTEGIHAGYFAWSCAPDGTKNSHGPAPDGEEYFALALMFASHRWGDGAQPPFNYAEQAREVLRACLHNGENGHGHPMWNRDNKLIKFIPECEYSDPSYHLPHFYELFALWANPQDRPFWKEAAEASRAYIALSCHPVTGLAPEYAYYDGTPNNERGFGHFYSDSYRVAANIGLDGEWFGARETLAEPARNIQAFFAAKSPDDYRRYTIDGKPFDEKSLHPVGLLATNAMAAMAAPDGEHARACVDLLWRTPVRTGPRRYYDNCLYMFAMLALSGQYRIWKPSVSE